MRHSIGHRPRGSSTERLVMDSVGRLQRPPDSSRYVNLCTSMMSKEYVMTQRVGDRDKVNYSFRPYAFTILSNSQSKCQKVIEYIYVDDENTLEG